MTLVNVSNCKIGQLAKLHKEMSKHHRAVEIDFSYGQYNIYYLSFYR